VCTWGRSDRHRVFGQRHLAHRRWWSRYCGYFGLRKTARLPLHRLRRLEPFLEVDLKVLEREMRGPVTRALDTWPAARKDLPAPDGIKDAITSRFGELPLVREVRPSMVGGHVVDGEPP
jgi:hypothetical protein